jgi:hyperosmotically inducible periplasmic protein
MGTTNAKQSRRWWVTCWVAASAAILLGVPAFASEPVGDYAYRPEPIPSAEAPRSFGGAISDSWITAKVKAHLIFEPGIRPLAVNVDTRDGVVTLFGSISTEDGRRAAGAEAMKVAGVTNVQNELQVVVKTAAQRVGERDGQIRDSVQQQLAERPALGDDDIDVEVANGVVRLSGSVAQSGDRMIALSLARSTDGVRAVVDGLRVEQQG